MINAIYGKKIGMTQIFNEDDRVVPVTVIQAEPNTICQVKTKDSDGYEAVQLGFGFSANFMLPQIVIVLIFSTS